MTLGSLVAQSTVLLSHRTQLVAPPNFRTQMAAPPERGAQPAAPSSWEAQHKTIWPGKIVESLSELPNYGVQPVAPPCQGTQLQLHWLRVDCRLRDSTSLWEDWATNSDIARSATRTASPPSSTAWIQTQPAVPPSHRIQAAAAPCKLKAYGEVLPTQGWWH